MKKRWILVMTICLMFMTGIRIHSDESVYTMTFMVVSDQGTPLQGAQFYVYKDGVYDRIVESDKKGCVRLENLTWGTYKLSQQVSAYGYGCIDMDIEFVIDENSADEGTLRKIVNKKLSGNLYLRIVNEEGERLKHTGLVMVDEQGKAALRFESDQKGEAVVKDVSIGSYRLQMAKNNEYDVDEKMVMEVTPFNYDRKDTITIRLHSLHNKEKPQDYSFVILFMILLATAIGYGIYFFRKHTITQFLDDFMV